MCILPIVWVWREVETLTLSFVLVSSCCGTARNWVSNGGPWIKLNIRIKGVQNVETTQMSIHRWKQNGIYPDSDKKE